jgi:hypothetical protein
MNNANPKVRYALFDYGGVVGKTSISLAAESHEAGRRGVSWLAAHVTPDALLERNRSRVLGVNLQRTDCDVVFMLDRDMLWRDTGDLIDLCILAHRHEAVVGGLYCKKAFGDGWAGAAETSQPLRVGDPTAELEEANYVATGAMAISRAVIEKHEKKLHWVYGDGRTQRSFLYHNMGIAKIREHQNNGPDLEYYDWFKTYRHDNDDGTSVIVPEDKAFCERLKYFGEKVYLAPQFVFGHVGEFTFMPNHGVKK